MANFKKPLATALGAAFLATAISPLASAEVNPFSAQQLTAGYDLANYKGHAEGGCGGDKAEGEGKCGEGKCGEGKGEGKHAEGSCGEDKAEGEGKCGEGKCGEGKGEEKAEGEGKCGEGKCGGK